MAAEETPKSLGKQTLIKCIICTHFQQMQHFNEPICAWTDEVIIFQSNHHNQGQNTSRLWLFVCFTNLKACFDLSMVTLFMQE